MGAGPDVRAIKSKVCSVCLHFMLVHFTSVSWLGVQFPVFEAIFLLLNSKLMKDQTLERSKISEFSQGGGTKVNVAPKAPNEGSK